MEEMEAVWGRGAVWVRGAVCWIVQYRKRVSMGEREAVSVWKR